MALPTTISADFSAPSSQGRSKPYISAAGNVYVFFRKTSNSEHVQAMKATDPTSSFSEASSLNALGGVEGIGTFQVGDLIYVAAQNSDDEIATNIFDMSDDTWDNATEFDAVTSAVGTNIDADKTVSISVETGGDIIIFYQGASDNDMGAKERVDRAYKTGGSWTVDQAVDDGGAVDYFLGGIVRGEADKFHLVFKDDTNRNALHKSVQDVDGTLSSVESMNDTNVDATDFSVIHPVYYDDAGVERITAGWRRSTGPFIVMSSEIDDDGTPGAEEETSESVGLTGEFVTASFAVDEKTVWLLLGVTGDDLWSDKNVDSGGWGTSVEEIDGITTNLITSNVYQRGSDIVLAYVYDDGGTIKYNEKVLRTVAAETPDMWHPLLEQPFPHRQEVIPY